MTGPFSSPTVHKFVPYTSEIIFYSRQYVHMSVSDVQALREELAEHGYTATPYIILSI